MQPNLRHCRMFETLARTRSVTRTAELCHVSQPAVTQAIGKLEGDCGMALFTRSSQGLFTTGAGELLARRMKRALAFLDVATTDMARTIRIRATRPQLVALIAVTELENFTLAARRLELAQPTVHRSIAMLEQAAERRLFDRTAHGLRSTRAARTLAQAARLAFAELDQASADLAALDGREVGRIVIGSLPLSRSGLLPAAILRFRKARPDFPFEIIDGRYDEILGRLRQGEIDMLIGALRFPPPITDIMQERLFDDTAVIVARHGHPLLGQHPNIALLGTYPWVMPRKSTPIRAALDTCLGDDRPATVIETSSLIMLRELLRGSDHLGGLSRLQAEAEAPTLSILPVTLAGSMRPIGLTTRKDWTPTVAQRDFLDILRRTAGRLN